MNAMVRVAMTAAGLSEAAQAADNATIEVQGALDHAPSLRLKPGQALRGAPGASIRFVPGQDGVVLTADNSVENIELLADPERCALLNDTNTAGFGRLALSRVRTTGCVRIVADGDATGGHVEVQDMHVMDADASGFENRPSSFGVEVVPGAFTLWNRHASQERRVSAELRAIAAGRAGRPVRGSGVLVGGTRDGGTVSIGVLETGDVLSDGGIAPGTADRIAGGVFILQGTTIDEVRNLGPVTTFGPNDMVLDNWGTVERWHAKGKVTSHGPTGIGFVNLGQLGTLTVDALIETHGIGACGFNCGEVKEETSGTDAAAASSGRLDGSVRQVRFERVVTRGDGAVGIQIAVPIGRLLVRGGVETFGGVGASLARGVVMKLAAVALSIKPGGSMRELVIHDGLTTHGRGVEALELHGQIGVVQISGAAGPAGGGFKAV